MHHKHSIPLTYLTGNVAVNSSTFSHSSHLVSLFLCRVSLCICRLFTLPQFLKTFQSTVSFWPLEPQMQIWVSMPGSSTLYTDLDTRTLLWTQTPVCKHTSSKCLFFWVFYTIFLIYKCIFLIQTYFTKNDCVFWGFQDWLKGIAINLMGKWKCPPFQQCKTPFTISHYLH